MWTQERLHDLTVRQRRFFRSGKTLDLDWRMEQLRRLKQAVLARQKEITAALSADLGRSEAEGTLCDVGPVVMEINENIRGLRRWAKPELHFSGLTAFPSTVTRVYKMPYGVSLIISPFNFPFVLSLAVLAAAMAGGNTAIVKVSSKSPHCTEVLKRLIADSFPDDYVALVDGGHDVADLLLEERFDKIFYTGSPKVGAHVMEAAAKTISSVSSAAKALGAASATSRVSTSSRVIPFFMHVTPFPMFQGLYYINGCFTAYTAWIVRPAAFTAATVKF